MAELLHLDLVTPEARAFSGEVEMVVVPGAMGDMGIMAHHAPILSLLRAGTIELHNGGAVTARYFVAGGYAEVHDNRCTVLAEHLTDATALTRGSVDEEITRLQRELSQATDEVERTRLSQALDAAQAKLLIAQ